MNAKTVKNIISKFSEINGVTFIGIKAYESTTSGEIANHVINIGFSYGNAVKKDIAAIEAISESDFVAFSEKSGFTTDLLKEAANKLLKSLQNNQNTETQSKQSESQTDAFLKINNAVKLHIESGKLYIYGMAISKKILQTGKYKEVNSRELTKAQNFLKRELNFSTSKYRQFIINPDLLSEVRIQGETYDLK